MANNSSGQSFFPAPSCFHLSDPTFHKVSERYVMNLVTAIINIISAPFAVVSNFLITIAIFNTSRLRTPLNLMIGCLALSDALVGLAVQPGYVSFRLLENQHRSVPCFVRLLYSNAFYICFGVSFMTLSSVSYERFVAVRLQARYNDVFSSKRVLKYMATIWFLNVLLTSLQWTGISKISSGIHLLVWFFCLLVSSTANIGIILILRRHRREVLSQQQSIAEQVRKRREDKLARSISFIVGVYLLFSMPVLFAMIFVRTYNHFSWTETLAFLNSSTNPLICLWKARQIRQAVKSMFHVNS